MGGGGDNHLPTYYSDDYYKYSGTPDSGPSEIGTQYNRPLYKGHRARNLLPYTCVVIIHFEPPKRGQPLYKGHNS